MSDAALVVVIVVLFGSVVLGAILFVLWSSFLKQSIIRAQIQRKKKYSSNPSLLERGESLGPNGSRGLGHSMSLNRTNPLGPSPPSGLAGANKVDDNLFYVKPILKTSGYNKQSSYNSVNVFQMRKRVCWNEDRMVEELEFDEDNGQLLYNPSNILSNNNIVLGRSASGSESDGSFPGGGGDTYDASPGDANQNTNGKYANQKNGQNQHNANGHDSNGQIFGSRRNQSPRQHMLYAQQQGGGSSSSFDDPHLPIMSEHAKKSLTPQGSFNRYISSDDSSPGSPAVLSAHASVASSSTTKPILRQSNSFDSRVSGSVESDSLGDSAEDEAFLPEGATMQDKKWLRAVKQKEARSFNKKRHPLVIMGTKNDVPPDSSSRVVEDSVSSSRMNSNEEHHSNEKVMKGNNKNMMVRIIGHNGGHPPTTIKGDPDKNLNSSSSGDHSGGEGTKDTKVGAKYSTKVGVGGGATSLSKSDRGVRLNAAGVPIKNQQPLKDQPGYIIKKGGNFKNDEETKELLLQKVKADQEKIIREQFGGDIGEDLNIEELKKKRLDDEKKQLEEAMKESMMISNQISNQPLRNAYDHELAQALAESTRMIMGYQPGSSSKSALPGISSSSAAGAGGTGSGGGTGSSAGLEGLTEDQMLERAMRESQNLHNLIEAQRKQSFPDDSDSDNGIVDNNYDPDDPFGTKAEEERKASSTESYSYHGQGGSSSSKKASPFKEDDEAKQIEAAIAASMKTAQMEAEMDEALLPGLSGVSSTTVHKGSGSSSSAVR